MREPSSAPFFSLVLLAAEPAERQSATTNRAWFQTHAALSFLGLAQITSFSRWGPYGAEVRICHNPPPNCAQSPDFPPEVTEDIVVDDGMNMPLPT